MNIETPIPSQPVERDGPLQILTKWLDPHNAGISVVLYKDVGLSTPQQIKDGLGDVFGVMTQYRGAELPIDPELPNRVCAPEKINYDEIVSEGIPLETARSLYDALTR